MDSILFNIMVFLGLSFLAHLSWKKIELGIMALVFCLPLYLIRLDIFGIPSTALELGIYLLFIVWFIKNYQSIKWLEIVTDKSFRVGIFLLLFGATFSAIFSQDLRTSAGILKGWFFDPFLFFVVLASEAKVFKQKENIFKIFFASGAVVAIISLFYKLGFLSDGVSFDGRLHAFYYSPNYLAMFLAVPFIIGVWFFLKENFSMFGSKKDGSGKSLFLVLIFLIALAIFYTYSYMAWFAITVAVLLLVHLAAPAEKKKIFFIAGFLILAVLFFSQIGTSKFENLKNLAVRSSFSSRIMIWRAAWEIGKDNPVFGVGPGNFQKYYLDYQPRFSEPYLEWAVPQPHNIFLAFWLEAGLLGVLGFVVILFWFFSHCFNMLRKSQADKDNFFLISVLFSIMVYIVIHGLVDTTYWKNDLAVIFWLELALLSSLKNE